MPNTVLKTNGENAAAQGLADSGQDSVSLIMRGSGSTLSHVAIAACIFVVTLTVYAVPMGNRAFFTRGEAREAIVVEEMIETGDLILPLNSGQGLINVETKPPMFHWLGVLASRLAGQVSEYSIRFPSAFCAALLLSLMFVFVAESSGVLVAAISMLVLAGTMEWNRTSSHARVDMVFTLGVTVCMMSLFYVAEFRRRTGRISWSWMTVACLASAFTVLAKGPFGLAFPWSSALVYSMIISPGSFVQRVKRLPWFSAIGAVLVALGIAGIWYWQAYLRGGQTFIQVHLMEENLGRFMSVSGDKPEHAKPFFYSVIYLFTSFFPFSLFLPFLAVWGWTERTALKRSPGVLFAAIWFAMLFVAVTISSSKREVYLLPMFPALAHLIAVSLFHISRNRLTFSRTLKVVSGGVAILFVALCAVALGCLVVGWIGGSQFLLGLSGAESREELGAMLDMLKGSIAVPMALLIAAGLLFVSMRKSRSNEWVSCAGYLGAAMIVVVSMVNMRVLPVAAADGSPTEFVSEMRRIVPQGATLVQYQHTFFPAMYYWDQIIPTVLTVNELPDVPVAYVLVRKDRIDELLAGLDNDEVVLESANNSANGDNKLLLVRYQRPKSAGA